MGAEEHTPGPWTLHIRPAGELMAAGIRSEPFHDVRGPDDAVLGVYPFNEADARLIAAAPDLLAALTALLDNGDDPHPLTGRDPTVRREDIGPARAAIARATGRTTNA